MRIAPAPDPTPLPRTPPTVVLPEPANTAEIAERCNITPTQARALMERVEIPAKRAKYDHRTDTYYARFAVPYSQEVYDLVRAGPITHDQLILALPNRAAAQIRAALNHLTKRGYVYTNEHEQFVAQV